MIDGMRGAVVAAAGVDDATVLMAWLLMRVVLTVVVVCDVAGADVTRRLQACKQNTIYKTDLTII